MLLSIEHVYISTVCLFIVSVRLRKFYWNAGLLKFLFKIKMRRNFISAIFFFFCMLALRLSKVFFPVQSVMVEDVSPELSKVKLKVTVLQTVKSTPKF